MKDITIEEAIKFLKNVVKQNGDLDSFTSVPFYKKEAKAINKILTELEKKDKIIDAMAEFIDTELSSEHLTRVLKKEVLPQKTYREDIKQYFEKEIKDE